MKEKDYTFSVDVNVIKDEISGAKRRYFLKIITIHNFFTGELISRNKQSPPINSQLQWESLFEKYVREQV